MAFVVLPIFALANTGILIGSGWQAELTSANSIGIMAGLVLGKPIGIFMMSFVGVMMGICTLPPDLKWRHLFGAGMLGGIGFTMSIFIANLAFPDLPQAVNASKMAILLASLTSGVLGIAWLSLLGGPGIREKTGK